MKRLLLFLFILLLVAVGIGFYRGWLDVASTGAKDGNKVEVNLTLDPDKARQDVKSVGESIGDKAEDLTSSDGEETNSVPPADSTPQDDGPPNEP